MTVALTITAADGAQTTINMTDPVVNPVLPASLAFQFEPARGGMFQSNAGVTSAVANGDLIGYLPDFSGNGFHMTSVGDDTTRPALQGVGTHPYVSFDGVNDLLRRSAQIGTIGNNGASSSLALAIRSSGNVSGSVLLGEGNSSSANNFYTVQAQTTPTICGFQSRDGTGAIVVPLANVSCPSAFDGTDHVLIFTDSGTVITPYLDGVAKTPLTYTPGGALALNVTSLGGLIRSTIGNWWSGRVYGALGANRVFTAAEITSANGYLTKLYTP